MSSYPKWLYHPTKPAVVVANEAAHRALGEGWYESPADFPEEPAAMAALASVGQAPKPKKVK